MSYSTFAKLFLVSFILLPLNSFANETIDLAGGWSVKLDPEDVGEKENWQHGFPGTAIDLPGICTEAGLGQPLNLELSQRPQVFRHLQQRHSYIGSAWYQREFDLPEGFVLKNAQLALERVLWKSKVWINGKRLGSESSLSTAHRFSTGGSLRAGKNRIVVCVDNREQVPMGTLSHAYTQQTQTIWNGLLGRLQLKPGSAISLEHLGVSPSPNAKGIDVSIEVNNRTGEPASIPVHFGLRAINEADATLKVTQELRIPVGLNTLKVILPAANLNRWSEFSPDLYEVTCELGMQRVARITGFRTVKADASRIVINGQQSFMRGTLDCCVFPKTGYPPTRIASWLKRFRTAKSYGLNHVRFHSWCPPEAAFAAADQIGVYLQIELPCWTDQMGKDATVNRFFESEGNRIFRDYGHHPSFVFFSLGNELKGDFGFVDQLLSRFQAKLPHVLMTSTSFSFSQRGKKAGPKDQFFVSQQTKSGWVRGQGFFNQNRPETHGDFSAGVASVSQPLISHEIGQYCLYPNLSEIEKHNGNLRSTALESIRADLLSNDRLAYAEAATDNSGKLALTLYKEEIERAIRTRGQDGFQLLSLTDFPGQSTATVGILDAFWDSKGLIEPSEFRKFCGPTVPLLRIEKRCFRSSETLQAKVQVGHFGQHPIKDSNWKVVVNRGEETLFSKNWPSVDIAIGNSVDIGDFQFPLKAIRRPCQLSISVACSDLKIENSWTVWGFPEVDPQLENVKVFSDANSEMVEFLSSGGSVLLLPNRRSIRNPIDGRFVPVFWSPLHFPEQPPTHGTIIRSDHPVFENFPTDSHTDWQWWELLSKSTSIDMTRMASIPPIMSFIDKFNRNAMPTILWEANVGKGKLFVCTLDIETDLDQRPVAQTLRNSILSYMNSAAFEPTNALTESQLETIFKSSQSSD